MVTFNVYKSTATGIYVEGVCLASDTKPVDGITNGSILFAVDTSDGTVTKYMFNQSAATWVEVQCPCSGGGSGGGSDLPEVSASDNGKLLTVVSGEWAAAAPSGGGAYFITATEEGQTVTITESYNDIKALLDAGTMVYLRSDEEIPDVMTDSIVLPLWDIVHAAEGYSVDFLNYSFAPDSDDLVVSVHTFTAATATSPMSRSLQ